MRMEKSGSWEKKWRCQVGFGVSSFQREEDTRRGRGPAPGVPKVGRERGKKGGQAGVVGG